MSLLSLPPELFGIVVHELVSVVSIEKVWRLRQVQRFQRNVLRLRLAKSAHHTIHLRVKVPTYVTIWKPLRGVDRSSDRTTSI
jgi:hypothetical protein